MNIITDPESIRRPDFSVSASLSSPSSSTETTPNNSPPSSPLSSSSHFIPIFSDVNDPVVVKKIEENWKEFDSNLSVILKNIGDSKVEWTDYWGTMYRQVFVLKTITRAATIELTTETRERLYLLFQQSLVFYVNYQFQLLVSEQRDSYEFVKSYLGKWCGYTIAIKYIHDIFGMHYFWVNNEQLPDIFTYGIGVWREHMFSAISPHIQRAVSYLLHLIRDHSDYLSTHQIRDFVFQFVPSLIRNQIALAPDSTKPQSLFEEDFQVSFINCMRDYFTKESLSILGDGCASNVADFMQKAELRLEEEMKRVKCFSTNSTNVDQEATFPNVYQALLHSCWFVCDSVSTVETSFSSALDSFTINVRAALHNVLIELNSNSMISACSALFTDGKWEDLNRMLRLLVLTNQSQLLEDKMRAHVADAGFEVVNRFEASPKKEVSEYVDSIHVLMMHYRNIVHTFPQHKFVQIIDKAFEATLNESKNSCRYIAQYVDSIIRLSVKKGSNDTHIEESLDKCIDMLNYLQDKDIFMVYYVHYLARRLIDTDLKSVDNDYERLMISKIKLKHGKSFTSKMEQMLKDVTLSNEIGHNFGAWIQQEQGGTTIPELYPTIMETGAWPSSILRDPGGGGECFLPLEVENAWMCFKTYYLSLYSGRKLVFTPHLGTAELNIHLNNKDFTATMSTFAMCVLPLFEHTDTLTVGDILSITNIPIKGVKLTIRALTTPLSLPKGKGNKKTRPQLFFLTNSEASSNCTTTSTTSTSSSSSTTNQSEDDDITESSQLQLNLNFGLTCPVKRFKLIASSPGGNNRSMQPIEDGQKKKREWQVDCIIVRVMKTRRRAVHNLLVEEVITISASQFVPSVPLIKSRIQALIEREFIARDANDKNVYIYLE